MPSGNVTKSPAWMATGSPPSGVTTTSPSRMRHDSCSLYCHGNVLSSHDHTGHSLTPSSSRNWSSTFCVSLIPEVVVVVVTVLPMTGLEVFREKSPNTTAAGPRPEVAEVTPLVRFCCFCCCCRCFKETWGRNGSEEMRTLLVPPIIGSCEGIGKSEREKGEHKQTEWSGIMQTQTQTGKANTAENRTRTVLSVVADYWRREGGGRAGERARTGLDRAGQGRTGRRKQIPDIRHAESFPLRGRESDV